ncbi:uncharacterized protein [Argopecten irradians]|uniref:uncharacterized protein n=1 Tax=Argopecten irradians TaxID=31199 RepID=UPI0037208604
MYCQDLDSSFCFGYVPATGTTCGDHKWCERGVCVYNASAPASSDVCPFGDEPGIVHIQQGVSYTCDELIGTFGVYTVCTIDSFYEKCCGTCGAFETSIQNCEFGDRIASCDVNNCDSYSTATLANCCETCYVAPTTTTTTASTTPTITTTTPTTTTTIPTTTTTIPTTTTTIPTTTTTIPTTTTTTPTTTTTIPTTTTTIPTTTTTIPTTTTTIPTTTTTIPTTTTTIPTTTTTTPTTTTTIPTTTTTIPTTTTTIPTTTTTTPTTTSTIPTTTTTIPTTTTTTPTTTTTIPTQQHLVVLYRGVPGFFLVRIRSFRRGSLIVEHEIETDDTPEATTGIINTLTDLASGGTVLYNNQSVTASGITLESDNGQDLNLTVGEDQCATLLLISNCSQGYSCIVLNNQSTCVQSETEDGNGLVIGLAVGLPALVIFVLLTMLRCFRGRNKGGRRNEMDEGRQIYVTNIRSRYNPKAPDWKNQQSFYLNQGWEADESSTEFAPTFSYLDAFHKGKTFRRDFYTGYTPNMAIKGKLRQLDLVESQSDV